MSMQSNTREFTGKHMLLLLVSFFGVVISVNILMAWFATSTWSGLVAKNGYVASIDYAHQEAAQQAASNLGWTVEVTADEMGHVNVVVRGDDGAPVQLDAVAANAVREVSRDDDVALTFASGSEGAWTAQTALPTGRWRVMLFLADDGKALDWRHVVTVAEK